MTPAERSAIRLDHPRRDGEDGPYCEACVYGLESDEWPCPTIRLLDALEQGERDRDRYRAALETIRSRYGGVCPTYEICDHRACNHSYGAWAMADEALGPREVTP